MSRLADYFPEAISRPTAASWEETLRAAPAGGAAYLIASADGQPVQLAGTQQLRGALRARLTQREDASARRAKLEDVSATVWWVRSGSQFETAFRFHLLARELYPASYEALTSISRCWFARACPDDHLPRFVATDRIGGEPGTVIGPFATRTACTSFIDAIQDVFDLCRYDDILEQTPHGTPCVYAEMNRCAVPCDGTQPLDAYRQTVREAVAVAVGAGEEVKERWRADMRSAAADQRYEQAASFKRRLDAVDRIRPRGGRFARDVKAFRYLVVQRDHARRFARPFFARQSGITIGEAVSIKEIEKHVERWRQALDSPTADGSVDWRLASEQASLLTSFLEKRERAPGVFLHRSELGDDAALAETVRAALAPKKQAGSS